MKQPLFPLISAGILFSPPAFAAIAYVQTIDIIGTSSTTSVTFAGFTAIGAGDSLVCGLLIHNATDTITTVVSGGFTYTAITATFLTYISAYGELLVAGTNITGGPTSINVTFSGTPTGTDHYLHCDEYSGSITSTTFGVDGSSAANASCTTTISTNSITTLSSNDMIWSTASKGGVTWPAPSGGGLTWTLRASGATGTGIASAEAPQVSPGAVAATWSSPSTTNLVSCYAGILAIKPLPSGGTKSLPSLTILGVGAS